MDRHSQLKEGHSWVKLAGMFTRFGMLLSIFIVFIVGTLDIVSEVPARDAAYISQAHLTQDILNLGVTRIYSDYWTCARLNFQSQERLICAILDDNLQAGQDRYMPYRDIVHADPHPGYVFQTHSRQAKHLPHRLGSRYQRYFFEHYVLYVYK